MAHGAGLIFLGLVMRRPGRSQSREGMALQTEQVDLADPQQTWIGGSVRSMATGAAFGFAGPVLIHKWPLLFRVAAEAGRIAFGRVAHLAHGGSAMHVVAVRAPDQTFVHAMVIGPRELGALGGMAGVAKIGLFFSEKMLPFDGVVRAVAIDAADLVGGVRRAFREMLRFGVAVAFQAAAARISTR